MIRETFYRATLPCGLRLQNRYAEMLRLIINKRHLPECGCAERDGFVMREVTLIDGIEHAWVPCPDCDDEGCRRCSGAGEIQVTAETAP